MKKFLVLSILCLPLAASAQTAAPKAPAAAPPQAAAKAPASPLESLANETLAMARSGNKAGALAKLKALASDPATTQPQLSLVGALYLQLDQPQDALAVLKPLADSAEAEPAVLYNAGRAALLSGQVDEARVYLTRSVLKEPASPAARDLGMLTARDGRVVEAYSMLRPWALHNPQDGDARLMAANLALQLERPDDAAQLLTGMPDSPAIRLLNGKVKILKKDGPGAVALLKPLQANHPQGMDLEVRRSLAEAQLLAGQPAEAVKLIEGKTEGHPSVALLLARAQRQAGNAAAATATLKPLADKLPENADAIGDPRPAAGIALEYATLLEGSGRAAEAVPFYEKSTRYYPRNPDAWKALAHALDATGRKADAQKALAQAAEAAKPPVRPSAPASTTASASAPPAPPAAAPGSPADPPLSEGIKTALRQMSEGEGEQALTTIRQEIAVSKDPRARMLENRILLILKRPEEALKAAEAAIATDPNNPDYIYLRGASEMSLRRMSSAEQDFRKTLQLQPRHLAAMNDLAVLLMQLHKDAEARKLLEQLLQINPDDKTAAANLEQVKARLETRR